MFGPIRQAAFLLWKAGTHREGCGIEECYGDSMECMWQDRAVEKQGYCHISLFCSLADWACNITDVLTDGRYDDLDLANADHSQVLSRFYTRILLVASELFADLEKLVMEARLNTNQQNARKLLSPKGNPTWLHDLHNFINRVCKHKYENIHLCNHHLPVCFEGDATSHGFSNPIKVGSVDIKGGDSIQYPSLASLCDGICGAYAAVNELFESDPGAFTRICDAFNDPSCSEEDETGA